MAIRTLGLSHLSLAVRDPQRSLDFYSRAFGVREYFRDANEIQVLGPGPHDVIAFARYENYNTQRVMPSGFVPLRQFDRSSWLTGITFKPVPDVAIKFDYAFNRNDSAVVKALNGINLGIGWWF